MSPKLLFHTTTDKKPTQSSKNAYSLDKNRKRKADLQDESSRILSNKRLKGVRNQKAFEKENDDSIHVVERAIINGLHEFINFPAHKSKGTIPTCVKAAVDAILVGATFKLHESRISCKDVARRLGINEHRVFYARKRGSEMNVQGNSFYQPKRSVWKEKIFENAKKIVRKFCHDSVYSCPESNYRTTHLVSGLMEHELTHFDSGVCRIEEKYHHGLFQEIHERRMWNLLGIKNRHQAFLQLPHYKEFKEEFPQGKKLCETYFVKLLCPCVKEPTIHSCVDVVMSQLDYLSSSAHQVLTFDPTVKEEAKKCSCAKHTKMREIEAQNK